MLYVAATPIGNLQDVSPNLRNIFGKCDFILCEDTRRTSQLLHALGISGKKLFSLHGHNEIQVSLGYIERMKQGETAILVSDAGTPAISDPGYFLVCSAHKASIPVRVIAGPSAVTSAMSVSGFSHPFHFLGFAPRKEGLLRQKLIHVSHYEGALIFFESGQRIGNLIAVIADLMPEREICLCRELTKLYEEIQRGFPHEFSTEPRKGECVLIIGSGMPIQNQEDASLTSKTPLKQLAVQLADLWGMNKREAYNLLQSIKPKKDLD